MNPLRTRSPRPEPALRMPASAATLAGFRTWATSDEFPERLRASFIAPEIFIDMSPEELETHAKVKLEISRVLANLNRELDLGEFYPDGTLVTNAGAGLSTEPDGTFVTWQTYRKEKVCLIPRENREGQYIELEGTPDWVLEVLSRSSFQKDTELLRAAYYRAGIPEYWLVDAQPEVIVFRILNRRRTGYAVRRPQSGWHPSRVFGREFRLNRRRNRLGRWQYTLEVRPI